MEIARHSLAEKSVITPGNVTLVELIIKVIEKECDNFNAIISAYELREINMTGGKFTWSNNQPDPTLDKLD